MSEQPKAHPARDQGYFEKGHQMHDLPPNAFDRESKQALVTRAEAMQLFGNEEEFTELARNVARSETKELKTLDSGAKLAIKRNAEGKLTYIVAGYAEDATDVSAIISNLRRDES